MKFILSWAMIKKCLSLLKDEWFFPICFIIPIIHLVFSFIEGNKWIPNGFLGFKFNHFEMPAAIAFLFVGGVCFLFARGIYVIFCLAPIKEDWTTKTLNDFIKAEIKNIQSIKNTKIEGIQKIYKERIDGYAKQLNGELQKISPEITTNEESVKAILQSFFSAQAEIDEITSHALRQVAGLSIENMELQFPLLRAAATFLLVIVAICTTAATLDVAIWLLRSCKF